MASNVLIQYKSLILTHETEAMPDVREAIGSTVLGSPGGIRYRQLDALRKIDEIKPLHFFPMRKKGELISVMAITERITFLYQVPCYTYYVRYVSFNPTYAVKTGLPETRIHRMGNSFMKEGMRKHAEDFTYELINNRADPKKIYYAFVEERNLLSINYTEFFFEKIRNFTIISFSSLFPRIDKRVTRIDPSRHSLLIDLLQKNYSKHSFFFYEDERLLSDYFILTEKDEILAGVRARVANWKIEELPGFFGRMTVKLLPNIPSLNRMIKPQRFTFLTFDTLYCREECDILLRVLFHSVCAILKVHAGMIYIDSNDPLCIKISGLRGMGLLNRIFGKAHGIAVAKFVGFTDEEKRNFYTNPIYISGYNLT